MSEFPATELWLERIKMGMQADPVLRQLKHKIFHWWPDSRRSILESIHLFWNNRYELSVEDGFIFKAHKLVIPASQKQEFLRDLHSGQLGEEKTLFQVQESVHWSGIIEAIREYIKRCDICQSTRPSQQKESVIPYDILSGPWGKFGIDIFQHRSWDYLLVVDYISNFPLVRLLNNQTAAHVVDILKIIFFKHRILAWVFTDQGRQFTSTEI